MIKQILHTERAPSAAELWNPPTQDSGVALMSRLHEPAAHDRQEVWPGGKLGVWTHRYVQVTNQNTYFTNNVIFIRVCENNMNDFITFCTDV